ncbi:MAG: Transcriptional regulator [Microgenomates bacterium 39_6]|nr:MAG: Transcriptional regulator [Microgenomates bacterium 39_6]
MAELKQQTKHISELLPKIARNLRIAPLIDEVKPGLTTSQLRVLLILKDMKDIALPVGKLVEELAVSFPSVSGIIDRLYREKLIERSRSRQDRRLVLVKLSNTGKEVIEKLLRAFEELLFDVLKKIPETERETIIKAIERVFEFSIVLSKDAHGGEMSLPETAT